MAIPNRKCQTLNRSQSQKMDSSPYGSYNQLEFQNKIIPKHPWFFSNQNDCKTAHDQKNRFFTGTIVALPFAILLWGIILLVIKWVVF